MGIRGLGTALGHRAFSLTRNLVKYAVLRDVSIRSDRFGRELMADLAVRFVVTNAVPGAYLEFGVFEGSTFAQFYHLFRRHRRAVPMFAFDSFQGLPAPRGLDVTPGYGWFRRGQFACSQAAFARALARRWVPRHAYTIVPGFYEVSLTPELYATHALRAAAVVWIDCVLYESVRPVLAFVRPLLGDGTVLIFNDYYRFRGNPALGERRAFAEFLAEHPDLAVTDYARFGSVGQAFIVHVSPPAGAGPLAGARGRERASRDWAAPLQG